MSLKRFLPYVFILSLLTAIFSCDHYRFDAEYDGTLYWKGGLKGPVIHGDLSLKDLLEKFDTTGYVSEDSTGLLYAAYSKDTILEAPALVDIPDQNFLQVFFRVDSTIPGAFLDMLGDTIPWVEEKNYALQNIEDMRLDSVIVKAGEMRIYVKSSVRHEGILTISSDQVFLNGQKYEEVIDISDATGTFENTDSIDLAGSTIIRDPSVTDSTSIKLLFEYDLINSHNDILVTEEVEIINSFHDLEFEAAYGYVGAFDSLLIDQAELEFDLLEENFEGTIKLANPQIKIRTDNSMGVPFGVELLDLEARFKDQTSTAITIDPAYNPITIDAPDIDHVGESVKDSTRFDTTNSNIHVAASSDLTGFQYSVRVLANPEGPGDNFVLDTSKLAVEVEGLVPLHLRIQDVILEDTFDFSLYPEDEDTVFGPDNIDYLMMRVDVIENWIPVDVGFQVYFCDSSRLDGNNNWLQLDSLFDETTLIIESGTIDSDGKVIQPSAPPPVDVEFSRTKIEKIQDVNMLIVQAFIETTNNGIRDVKFFSNNHLKFKLATHIEVNYTHE